MKNDSYSFPSDEEINDLDKHILKEREKNTEQLKKAYKEWLTAHWENKLSYEPLWLGMPIIQTAEDMMIMQEIVFKIKPDFIVEMGIAHGGSLIYYASLLKLLGRGRVIGVDVDIREHNRKLLEKHPLIELVDMIEASSIEQSTFEEVKKRIPEGSKVIVILDSCHEKDHVLKEMELYSPLVSKGSYLVVCDTIMPRVAGLKYAKEDFDTNNPKEAIEVFMKKYPNQFAIDRKWEDKYCFTYFPGGFLKKL